MGSDRPQLVAGESMNVMRKIKNQLTYSHRPPTQTDTSDSKWTLFSLKFGVQAGVCSQINVQTDQCYQVYNLRKRHIQADHCTVGLKNVHKHVYHTELILLLHVDEVIFSTIDKPGKGPGCNAL